MSCFGEVCLTQSTYTFCSEHLSNGLVSDPSSFAGWKLALNTHFCIYFLNVLKGAPVCRFKNLKRTYEHSQNSLCQVATLHYFLDRHPKPRSCSWNWYLLRYQSQDRYQRQKKVKVKVRLIYSVFTGFILYILAATKDKGIFCSKLPCVACCKCRKLWKKKQTALVFCQNGSRHWILGRVANINWGMSIKGKKVCLF